jgi:hypothetical protein
VPLLERFLIKSEDHPVRRFEKNNGRNYNRRNHSANFFSKKSKKIKMPSGGESIDKRHTFSMDREWIIDVVPVVPCMSIK